MSAEELRRRGAPPMALSYAKRFGEIRIDWQALGVHDEDGDQFRFVGGQRLIIEPFAGLRLEAIGISVREGAEGAQTWMERIERPGWGQVTITRHRDAVFGSVDYGVDRYVLQSGREGRIFVREVDQRGLGRCAFDARSEGLPRFDQGLIARNGKSSAPGATLASASSSIAKPDALTPLAAKSSGHATVDILVLYTPEVAADAAGNPQAMIQNYVDHANLSFIDGQIQGSLNLVGTSLITGVNQALGPGASWVARVGELQSGAGPFSSVPALRDSHGADLVALLVVAGAEWLGGQWVQPQACGYANLGSRADGLTNPSVGSNQAFSITDVACSAADLTFTHEIGHNLGGRHDDDTEDFRPLANSVTPEHFIVAATRESVGYTRTLAPVRFRTLMGSRDLVNDACSRVGDPDGCGRINRWSSPDQQANFYGIATVPLGAETGVCIFPGYMPTPCTLGGVQQESDMVASHRFAMPHVASYRSVQQAPPLPPVFPDWATAHCGKSIVRLAWSPPSSAGGPVSTYEVEASPSPGFPWWDTALIYVGAAPWHEKQVLSTTHFRVRACNQAGCSAWSGFDRMPIVHPWC